MARFGVCVLECNISVDKSRCLSTLCPCARAMKIDEAFRSAPMVRVATDRFLRLVITVL